MPVRVLTEELPERAVIRGIRQNWDALGAELQGAKFVSLDHMSGDDRNIRSLLVFRTGDCDYVDLVRAGW